MRKPPDLKELEACVKKEYAYDFDQAERILEAMNFLRKEAVKTRIPEIVEMVDASFRLLVNSYYCILRYEIAKLPPVEEVH